MQLREKKKIFWFIVPEWKAIMMKEAWSLAHHFSLHRKQNRNWIWDKPINAQSPLSVTYFLQQGPCPQSPQKLLWTGTNVQIYDTVFPIQAMTVVLSHCPRGLNLSLIGQLFGTSERYLLRFCKWQKKTNNTEKGDRNGLRCLCFLNPQKNPGIK